MNNIKISKLHLVDLAGSERQKDTNTEDLRLKVEFFLNYFTYDRLLTQLNNLKLNRIVTFSLFVANNRNYLSCSSL